MESMDIPMDISMALKSKKIGPLDLEVVPEEMSIET